MHKIFCIVLIIFIQIFKIDFFAILIIYNADLIIFFLKKKKNTIKTIRIKENKTIII